MKVTKYMVTDVFTSQALSGNALAVVLDGAGMDEPTMQSIAREFNLSETAFVHRRTAEIEAMEGVRVRIFTAREELNFAGHPTLGTASVLRSEAPETVRDNTVTLALNVGAVPVRFHGDSNFGEMTQKDPVFGIKLDRQRVAELTSLKVEDLDADRAPQVVSTGTSFVIVLLKSADALASLRVVQSEATAWLRQNDARWFYVLGPTGKTAASGEPEFRARMQCYGGEDPATGSAAGCAISYLVATGAAESGRRVLIRQGVEISRPSELYLSAKQDGTNITDVRVGGSTVLAATGQLFLP